MTKSVHFMPMKATKMAEFLAQLYINNTIRQHDIPKEIVFDKILFLHLIFGTQFKEQWRQGSSSVLPTILRLTIRVNTPSKP